MAMHLNAQDFETKVMGGEGLVLVDFWADWCGPCRRLGPVIDEIAEEMEGALVVGKVNIDEENELATRFSVMSIPTVILFKNGQEVDRTVGAVPKQQLLDLIENGK